MVAEDKTGDNAARLDMRSAADSDAREKQIVASLAVLREVMQNGSGVEIVWPGETAALRAGNCLEMPLAMKVYEILRQSGETARIHARSLCPDFLRLQPLENVTFVFSLNSEEAAMRWEREDISPARRLATAARLKALGWNVRVDIGPVRQYDGWREDYGDVAMQAGKAGFQNISVSLRQAASDEDTARIHSYLNHCCTKGRRNAENRSAHAGNATRTIAHFGVRDAGYRTAA